MVFLLVVATLLAPIAALVFADWWREHKRAKREANSAKAREPGWVAEEIRKRTEGKTP